jgi:hypothetical protein
MKSALPIALCLAPALLLLSAPARAQQGAAPAPPATAAGKTKALSSILTNIKKDTGASVLAASALASSQVKPPAGAVTPETLEETLDALVKGMPTGTLWAKLWLPPLAGGRQFKGDDLVDYAVAQSRLYPGVGASQPGVVEVLGQKLPADKAESVIQTLGLKPVYVICNPTKTAPGSGEFENLSDDQKKNAVDKQVQKLLSLPPEQQAQALGQMFQQAGMVFGNLMRNMSPDQRRGFMQNMGPMMGMMMREIGGPGGGGAGIFFGGPPRN